MKGKKNASGKMVFLLPCHMEALASCKKSSLKEDRIWDVQPSKRRDMREYSHGREKWFWTVRLCVSVCLAIAFPANSHGRKG